MSNVFQAHCNQCSVLGHSDPGKSLPPARHGASLAIQNRPGSHDYRMVSVVHLSPGHHRSYTDTFARRYSLFVRATLRLRLPCRCPLFFPGHAAPPDYIRKLKRILRPRFQRYSHTSTAHPYGPVNLLHLLSYVRSRCLLAHRRLALR